jgi:hypothetical protein
LLSYDPEGHFPATGVFAVGTIVNLTCSIVGFNASQNQIWVKSCVSAVDESGHVISLSPIDVTIDKRLTNAYDRASARDSVVNGIPFQGKFGLTRPGNFRIRIELKDNIGKKTAVYEIPIVVVSHP